MGKQQTLKWQVEGNANTVSRNIRKAIELAGKTTTYRKYGILISEYKLCVENALVIAKPRRIVEEPAKEQPRSKQIVEDELNISQLVGWLVTFNPDEVYFPKVVLAQQDLVILERYCKHANLTFVNHEQDGITIRKTTENNQ